MLVYLAMYCLFSVVVGVGAFLEARTDPKLNPAPVFGAVIGVLWLPLLLTVIVILLYTIVKSTFNNYRK